MNTVQSHAHDEPRLVAAAERQMHAWEFHRELQERASQASGSVPTTKRLANYVTISREAGAGASLIAELVGRVLGWQVFDKNLLDCTAEQYHLSRDMLELVDETPSNWVYDVLGTWMDRQIVSHERYVTDLSRVVVAMARRGNAVFVGRGAQFLLPRDKNLAVRIVAPEKMRLKRIMELRRLDADKARRYMDETDRGRREFVHRFFHHDISDPQLYDLIINVKHVGIEGAVEMIVKAVGR